MARLVLQICPSDLLKHFWKLAEALPTSHIICAPTISAWETCTITWINPAPFGFPCAVLKLPDLLLLLGQTYPLVSKASGSRSATAR